MKLDLKTLLAEIRGGRPYPLVLLYGDDFRVDQATKAILDRLLPARDRALSIERFDGSSAGWDEIEGALRTPPLFADRKVVLVEKAPYFLPREQREELSDVLELWRAGRKEEAARLFLQLLSLEGVVGERWAKFEAREAEELFEGRGSLPELGALLGYCWSTGLAPRARKAGHRLAELLDEGLPPRVVLLMTASHVDRRSRLYRQFEERAVAVDLTVERDRTGRIDAQELAEFLSAKLGEAGKKIDPEAKALLLERAGGSLWGFNQELEKLLLYVGEEPWVRARDVEEVWSDQAEGWIFDLIKLIGERDALGAVQMLGRLVSQGDAPLRLLAAMAGEVRRLLVTRALIEGELGEKWNQNMSYSEFQRSVLQKGPLLTRSPFGDYLCFKRAGNFTTRELVRHLERIHETDLRLKSTGQPPRLLMERLVLDMCRG